MRLQYIGPFDAVTVPLPSGGELAVDQGGTIDVPDSHAVLLLEQPTNWVQAKKPAAAKAADPKESS